MKQIGVPSIFRSRRSKAAAAAKNSDAADGDSSGAFPSSNIGRINIVPSSSPRRVIGVANEEGATVHNSAKYYGEATTVSTLTNGSRVRRDPTMKRSERIIESEERSYEAAYDRHSTPQAVGIDHLSTREQMWYKNQIYLLDKQGTSNHQNSKNNQGASSRGRLATRYGSRNRNANDRYPYSDNERYSPKGVDEFDSVDVNTAKEFKHCDSRSKEVRFRANTKKFDAQEEDNDAYTNQSSTLFGDDDTRTNQSSSLFGEDIDTRTSLDDDTRANQSNFDEVTLGSATLDTTGDYDTVTEGFESSYMTYDDDGTSKMSYVFELLDDDDGRQRRKYQYGVGQRSSKAFKNKSKEGTLKVDSSKDKDGTSSSRRRVAVHAPRGRQSPSVDDVPCPFLPTIMEEVTGTYLDAKLACEQVLHAFFVSPDDIDRVADKIRDAKLELGEFVDEVTSESRKR